MGIDGAGKTTNAKRLIEWMKKGGVDAKYIWNSYVPKLAVPAIVMIRALFFRGKDALSDFEAQSNFKRSLVRKSVMAVIYQYFLLFEYVLHIYIDFKPKLKQHKYIVCDRYVYDLIVLLTIELGYTKNNMMNLLYRIMLFIPKPDLLFLIDIPEELAYTRKNDTPSLKFLCERRNLYSFIGKFMGVTIINGSDNIKTIDKIIHKKVSELLN